MSYFDEKRFDWNRMTMREATKYHVRLAALICWDAIVIQLAAMCALLIRFDFSYTKIEPGFWENMVTYSPINIILTIIIFFMMHLYTSLWRYASVREAFYIAGACIVSSICYLAGVTMLELFLPRSFYLLYAISLTVLVGVGRFGYRLIRLHRSRKRILKHPSNELKNVMIIGAGAAGNMLVHEIKESLYLHSSVKCIIDDDPLKKGSYLNGIPIVGGRNYIQEAADRYGIDEIIFAVPSISDTERKKILSICTETGCKLKTIPGLYQLVNNEVTVNQIREVEIEDLLGRDPVNTDIDDVLHYVQDQVVLVTGGGGSIGSEICRQVARKQPKQLVIVDNYENNVYDLQMELKRTLPNLNMEVLIATVQNKYRLEEIFRMYHPDIIFHAAAHKHVPLMEDSPCESIKNNVIGTYNVACTAHEFHVKRMVLISTDKAVRPTNIMGASKRICEMIMQSFNKKSDTIYAAVRFGNVLGSNGSVIPLFKEQIKNGGPVTVTHKDIIRYFMTIPEAVSLVLQAGAYAHGGEVFILDMGEPVRIYDLAENLIRLSGFTPNVDIKIEITGLRPGEKLYEELLIDDNSKGETPNKRIFIGHPPAFDEEEFWQKLAILKIQAMAENPEIRALVKEVVPEYTYKK